MVGFHAQVLGIPTPMEELMFVRERCEVLQFRTARLLGMPEDVDSEGIVKLS